MFTDTTAAMVTRRIKKNLAAADLAWAVKYVRTTYHAYDQWLTYISVNPMYSTTAGKIRDYLAPLAAAECHNIRNCYISADGTVILLTAASDPDAGLWPVKNITAAQP